VFTVGLGLHATYSNRVTDNKQKADSDEKEAKRVMASRVLGLGRRLDLG